MEAESYGDKGNMLESALIDQRMRAEKHKANFDTLKAQHVALQEVCWKLQIQFVLNRLYFLLSSQKFQNMRFEYDTLLENYDSLHQKSQEIIQTLQTERDDKIVECESLRKHVSCNTIER